MRRSIRQGIWAPGFIVVLNDNGMSISPTVGALAKLLSRVRFDHRYRWAKEESKRVLAALPLGKQAMADWANGLGEDSRA